MFDAIRLYFRFIGVNIRGHMQYRASFMMLSMTYFLSTFVDILGIWVLFDRFKMIQGWTIEELALIYGIVHMGFAIAETSARSFDTFSQMLKSGDFDLLLLRPRGTLFQIATRDFQLMRMGRFLQGFLILLWGFHALHLSLFSINSCIIVLAVIGTASLFYGLLVLQGTLSFWTTETLELMNILTFGGVESGQYPMSIYKPGFRLFFTFIIPLACVGFYPMAILLRHESWPLEMALVFPLAGILFLLFSCALWKKGVQHYRSTGS